MGLKVRSFEELVQPVRANQVLAFTCHPDLSQFFQTADSTTKVVEDS
jgi:hypothetical protein